MSHTESSKLGTAAMHAAMRVLFRPVFGWSAPVDAPATALDVPLPGGGSLEGYLLRCSGSARGVVLLCHPFLKYGMHYFRKSEIPNQFVEAGYDVVAFNFMGFGKSTLGHPGFPDNVVAMVDWIQKEFPDVPIHLVGFSFGGYHGIHALPRLGGKLSTAVFDSVPPYLENFFSGPVIGPVMRRMGRSRWSGISGTAPIESSLSGELAMPVLLMFGSRDKYAPPAQQRSLQQLPHRMKVFDGAGHLECHKVHRDEYQRTINDFFDQFADTGGRSHVITA